MPVVAAQRVTEVDSRIEAVQIYAATPARVKRLRVEHAIAGADHGFVIQPIGEANARREGAVPESFRVTDAGAGIAPFVAGKYQAAGQVPGAGIRAEVKESRVVARLKRGRELVPAQAVVDRQPGWSSSRCRRRAGV